MTTDRRAAPLHEFAHETWADWLRRQGNPVKPAQKNAPSKLQLAEGSVSEKTNQKEIQT